MTKYTFTAPDVQKDGHGTRYDRNFRPPRDSDLRGRQFDEFNRQPHNPHGPQSDEGYRPAGHEADGDGDAFERVLRNVPEEVRGLPLRCPCGRTHTLEGALRGAVRAAKHGTGTTGKTGGSNDNELDVMKTVRESDDAYLRSGAGEPDDLHRALVESIEKTYGISSRTSTVAKTASRGRGREAPVSSHEEAIARLRRMPGLKT